MKVTDLFIDLIQRLNVLYYKQATRKVNIAI